MLIFYSTDGPAALYVTNANDVSKQDFYYLYTDNQGSLTAVADPSGNILHEFSYDAWGRRRNTTNSNDYTVVPDALGTGGSQLFTRGYTFHEQLDAFALTNMNGRMYDPRLGRFLSPDNYVQQPDNTQNYNRYSYSYCMNNPMKYVDPSGDWIEWVIAAVFFYGMTAQANAPEDAKNDPTKWAWNPKDWFGKNEDGTPKPGAVFGVNVNSGGQVTIFAGVTYRNQGIYGGYNSKYGGGIGPQGGDLRYFNVDYDARLP